MMGRSRRVARRTSRRTSRRVGRRQAAMRTATAPAPQETAPPQAAPPQAEAPQTKPYVQELEELAALRDKGIISEEEFQAKKKQILNL